MKRLLRLTLSFAVCFPGLIALSAAPARAQQVAAVGSLDTLRQQYEQMLAVERSAATPPEVRDLNRTFLEERRAQLAAAIRNRVGALVKYRAAVAATLRDDEKRAIDDSVARLSAELRALLPEAVPPAVHAARRTRRPARAAVDDAPVVEASFAAPASAELAEPAVPSRAEPAALTTAGSAAPIQIVSPERDRVVHTSEVELEVSVRDDAVDDLMVAVYTPASEKPKTARVLNVRRSDRGSKSIVVALSKGDNRVEVSDLKRSEVKAERNITYTPPEVPALNAAAAAFVKPAAAAPQAGNNNIEQQSAPIEYDWGRVRSYFTAGMIFSKEREEFSKSDLALSFVLDKNYYKSLKWNLNTFFEARLTSIPVAAMATDEAADGGEDGEEPNQLDTFITSKKAGFAQAGVYLPVNVTAWKNQRELNTLFIAPLAKGGVMTITGDRRTAEAETFGDDDVFNFYSFGVRLGHFRYPRLRHPCTAFPQDENCDSFADYAPELISWLDITTGRWENFELTIPTGQLDADGNPITTRQRRWRYQAEGRLKIPETPFMVGFDGNFGQGPDDLRFGFGMRFDVAKLIHRLKLQALFEEEAARQPANNNGGGGGATPPNN